MIQKASRISGTILIIFAFITMLFPICHAHIDEGWDITIKGYEVIGFSFWGLLIIILPLMMLGIVYSNLDNHSKIIPLFVILILSVASLYLSKTAAYNWLGSIASGFITPYSTFTRCALFQGLATVCFYFGVNENDDNLFHSTEDLLNYIEKEHIALKSIDVFEENFFLCHRQHDFCNIQADGKSDYFHGRICFSTSDNNFSAMGQTDKPGTIEVLNGDENTGFISHITPAGMFGVFYPEATQNRSQKYKILPGEKLEEGNAEMWIPTKEGGFQKKSVEISLDNSLECRLNETSSDESFFIGAVIMQKGKIAAVVSGYDEKRRVFRCTYAETVAYPLLQSERKNKILQALSK